MKNQPHPTHTSFNSFRAALAVAVAGLALGLTGCGQAEPGGEAAAPADTEQVVNLYTQRHYELDQEIYDRFAEETGITVNVVKAGADQLIERLKAEGEDSPADLFLTVDIGRMARAQEAGLLQPSESEVLAAQVPAAHRGDQGDWYGITKRGRVIAYHKDRVSPEELSNYEDLADPKWKGRILVRSSSNLYNQALVASLIAEHGPEKVESWARGFVDNLARSPKGNDRDQMRAVAAGEGDLALVNTYYLGLLANGSPEDQAVAEQIGIFFPNQEDRGTHVNLSAAGITKSAQNKENAIRLLEFLTSEPIQEIYAESNYEYPVNPNVEAAGIVQSWGTFKEDDLGHDVIGQHEEEALKLADRVGWQ
ncbi:MAG: Fe(3+) ABC transporter substrate-binding protein [Verrucomicrobiota bacterium]